jgi:dTDP-4-amino-4,6-dideoxy-D-galactose acyltransferase
VASTATPTARPALARLDWECAHFEVDAAQLGDAELNDGALAAALRLARQRGVRLVVWPARGGRNVPAELLAEFGGVLVDRKATFSRPLGAILAEDVSGSRCELPVIPYTATTVSTALGELALAAGGHSRFQVDPHFSAERFAAMYRLWIERSVAKELADAALVVPLENQESAADQPLGGMITLAESGGVASIGLIAVAATVRGRGVGSLLMREAHHWMRQRGAHEVRVVTQLANQPACRLYERSGYRLARVQHFYHFWLA